MSRYSLLLASAALGLALTVVLIGLALSFKAGSAVHTESLLAPAAECGGLGSDRNDTTVAWRSTVDIETYEYSSAVTNLYIEELWGVPNPYTFFLSHLGNRLSDPLLNWKGDGNCAQGSSNDILCTGDVEYLFISYRCYFTPLVESGVVYFDFWPPDRADRDYELALFYPPQFVFVTSTFTPTHHAKGLPTGNHAVYWYPVNMQDFETRVTFREADMVFLPLIAKSY